MTLPESFKNSLFSLACNVQ